MKYYDKYEDVPVCKEVWACAYETNNTEKSMSLKKKPVKGKVVYEPGHSNHWSNLRFYELKKNGDLKSHSVFAGSRRYADTEEEYIEMYNEYIYKQIGFLQELIEKTKEDLIPVSKNIIMTIKVK